MKISEIQKEAHAAATDKGWHDDPNLFGDFIANLHGEVSEAWEWHRSHDNKSYHIPAFYGVEEEMADVIIRILDAAQEYGWDIEGALRAKMDYNKTRSYRHGDKRI